MKKQAKSKTTINRKTASKPGDALFDSQGDVVGVCLPSRDGSYVFYPTSCAKQFSSETLMNLVTTLNRLNGVEKQT